MKKTGRLQSSDGKTQLFYQIWEPEEKPKAILQIIHGMTEYIDRYDDLACYLNSFGILVAGDDHIGHGHSCEPEDWGYFGEKDGWKHFIDDEEKMREMLSAEYPDTPYIMMGHSMGSFIIRGWLSMYGRAANINGAIICGTAGSNPALGAGKALAKFLRKIKGSKYVSNTITGLAFGAYTKGMEDAETGYEWLTHDHAVLDKYTADPMCTFRFTLAGYQDLFELLGYINTEKCYENMPKQLPYLIVAGLEDPVGSYGKGPVEVKEKMEKAGCTDVSQILYMDMRHEIFNEIGKETVYEDFRDFCLDMMEEANG